MNGTMPYGGRRERARRAAQAREGVITPALLKADRDAIARGIEAVDRGRKDGEIDAATFDIIEDAFGRMPTWYPPLQRVVSMNVRFTKNGDPRESLRMKGAALYRAGA